MNDDALPSPDDLSKVDASAPLAALLTKSVWPLATVVDGQVQDRGTGFIVSRGGLMITAWHACSVLRRDARKSRAHGRVEYDGLFFAMCPSDNRLFCVDVVTAGEGDDVAVCQLRPFDGMGSYDFTPLKLRLTPPAVGEEVVAFGYDQIDLLGDPVNEGGFYVKARGHFTAGEVTKVHWPQREQAIAKFPGFDFNGAIYPGMSGGPILNEKNVVCGVASFSPQEKRPGSAAGLALVLGADLSLPDGADGPARNTTLYELLREGTIEHDGSLDQVCLDPLPGGGCRVILVEDWGRFEPIK